MPLLGWPWSMTPIGSAGWSDRSRHDARAQDEADIAGLTCVRAEKRSLVICLARRPFGARRFTA